MPIRARANERNARLRIGRRRAAGTGRFLCGHLRERPTISLRLRDMERRAFRSVGCRNPLARAASRCRRRTLAAPRDAAARSAARGGPKPRRASRTCADHGCVGCYHAASSRSVSARVRRDRATLLCLATRTDRSDRTDRADRSSSRQTTDLTPRCARPALSPGGLAYSAKLFHCVRVCSPAYTHTVARRARGFAQERSNVRISKYS